MSKSESKHSNNNNNTNTNSGRSNGSNSSSSSSDYGSLTTIGVIGGSGLLQSNIFTHLDKDVVDTPYGKVRVRQGTSSKFPHLHLVFVQRHEADPEVDYSPAHVINHRAIMSALNEHFKVKLILGICSAGSLQRGISIGSFVVPEDFYSPADIISMTNDKTAHTAPGLDEDLRQEIIDALRKPTSHSQSGFTVYEGGVYVQTKGPRFETKAEIRVLSQAGDVVGMTGAHEATLAKEVGVPYAQLCMIDNMANGIDSSSLSLESFKAQVHDNQAKLEQAVWSILERLDTHASSLLRFGKSGATYLSERQPNPSSNANSTAGTSSSSSSPSSSSKQDSGWSANRNTAPAIPPAIGTSSDNSLKRVARMDSDDVYSDSSAKTSKKGTSPSSTFIEEDGKQKRVVDLIAYAKHVVTVNDQDNVIDDGAVVVNNGKILDVCSAGIATANYAARESNFFPESAIMPGLVNAHTHTPMIFMRGFGDDMPLGEWLSTHIFPAEGKCMSDDFVRQGVEVAASEMIRSGTTTFNDMYFFPEGAAEVVDRVGIRAYLGLVMIGFPTPYASGSAECFEKGEKLWQRSQKQHWPRIQFTMAPHAPYSVAESDLQKAYTFSKTHGIPFHTHMHETQLEVESSIKGDTSSGCCHQSDSKTSPLKNFERLGMLDQKSIFAHMTQLTEEEIKLVAKRGCNIAHCPSSNMKLASGFCPVTELLKADVNVCIGTDGAASNNTLDMFAEMKLAAILAKGFSREATTVPAHQAIRMATINGAKALGGDRKFGSLEVGKDADFIAVRLNRIETQPTYDVLSTLCYAADRASVTHSWVQGHLLMRDRELTTINEQLLRETVDKWRTKMREVKAEMQEA